MPHNAAYKSHAFIDAENLWAKIILRVNLLSICFDSAVYSEDIRITLT